MNASAVAELVRAMLAAYRYEMPAPGTTLGTPWSEEKVAAQVRELERHLIEPYVAVFELRETRDQISSDATTVAEYWVVAETDGYVEWYNPAVGEFGLGVPHPKKRGFVSIGVKGDLVGVFCAM